MSVIDYISNLDRPSYAPSFDGTYFDGTILGYRTNSVEGRDSIQSSITELSSEIRDGALFRRNRRQTREITVKFAITTDSPKELHDSADKLKGLITNYSGNVIEKSEFKVIFDDEPDKFYKGVITNFTMEQLVNANNASGQFVIHCSDPFKYSVDVYTVQATPSLDGLTASIVVDYDGTMPAYPKLIANTHDPLGLGCVGFINQNGKVIQVGIPDAVEILEDEDPKTKSEIIFPDSTEDPSAFGEDDENSPYDPYTVRWQVNPSGFQEATDNLMKVGDKFSATGTVTYGAYISGKNMHATGYGQNGDAFDGWHGPVLTRKDSYFQDSNGSHSHKSGTLEFKHSFVTGANDYGEFIATLDKHELVNGTIKRRAIAKIVFFKKTKGTNKASCNLMMYSKTAFGGKTVNSLTFDSGVTGTVTKETMANNAGPATHKITKIGDKVTFSINGSQYSYVDPEIEDMDIDGVSFAFAKHKATTIVSKNLLYSAKFISHSVADVKDIPNMFSYGDVITANTANGVIEVNGVTEYGIGALGNDWETFYLSPGINEITCTFSTLFTAYEDSLGPREPTAPDYIMEYRKVYL